MSNVLQELVVKLTVDQAGFVTGLKKSLFSAEAWKRQMIPTMKGLDQAFGSIIKSAKAMSVAFVAIGSAMAVHMVRKANESIDAMAKLSDRTAINIETLYGFKVAAEDVGVSLESVAGSITKLQRNISTASSGTGEMADAFKTLGLSVTDLRALTPDEAFIRIIDALDKVPNAADKTALKMQILGRSANELTNFFALGGDKLREYTESAKKLGLTVSRIDAAKIEATNDAWTAFGHAIDGFGNRLAILVAGPMKAAADWMTTFITQGDKGKAKMDEWFTGAVEAAGDLANGFQVVQIAINAFLVGVAGISAAFYGMVASGAYAFKYIYGLASNIAVAIVAWFKLVGSAWNEIWVTAKVVFAKFAEYVNIGFAAVIRTAAVAVSALDEETGKTMRGVADSMVGAAEQFSQEMRNEWKKSADDVVARTGDLTKAVKGVFDVKVDISNFKVMAGAAGDFLIARTEALAAAMKAPWASEMITNWVASAQAAIQTVAEEIAKTAPGENGPAYNPFSNGDAMKKKFEEYRKTLNEQLEALTLDQVMWEANKNKQIEIMTKQNMNDAEREEAASIARTNALRQQGLKGQLIMTSEVLGQLSALMQSHDKRAFELGKVAAIANAVINTAQGATKALAQGGFYGIAMAGAVVAAGAVQIAQIKGTSFSGGGSGSGGKVGSASTLDSSQDMSSSSTSSRSAPVTKNITIIGSSLNQSATRQMVDELNDAGDDGAVIRVSQRRR